MKKRIRIRYDANRVKEREVNYIPVRYILALLLAVLETSAVITIVILFGKYVPYFYLAMWATEIGCVIHIIACDEALCQAVENAALRGVQVKLILPAIPDKWLVKELAAAITSG